MIGRSAVIGAAALEQELVDQYQYLIARNAVRRKWVTVSWSVGCVAGAERLGDEGLGIWIVDGGGPWG